MKKMFLLFSFLIIGLSGYCITKDDKIIQSIDNYLTTNVSSNFIVFIILGVFIVGWAGLLGWFEFKKENKTTI